jgi:hypothetical protein
MLLHEGVETMAIVVDAKVSVEAVVVAMEAATTTEETEEAATTTVASATVGKSVANLDMEPLNGIGMKRTTNLKKK